MKLIIPMSMEDGRNERSRRRRKRRRKSRRGEDSYSGVGGDGRFRPRHMTRAP